MTIAEIWHKITQELQTLLHLHPSNTAAIAAKKAEITTLAEHPALLPEQKEAVKTLVETTAAVVPELLPTPLPSVPSVAEPAPATEPAPTPAP